MGRGSQAASAVTTGNPSAHGNKSDSAEARLSSPVRRTWLAHYRPCAYKPRPGISPGGMAGGKEPVNGPRIPTRQVMPLPDGFPGGGGANEVGGEGRRARNSRFLYHRRPSPARTPDPQGVKHAHQDVVTGRRQAAAPPGQSLDRCPKSRQIIGRYPAYRPLQVAIDIGRQFGRRRPAARISVSQALPIRPRLPNGRVPEFDSQ